LVENIEVFGAGKSNLLVWNPDGQESRHITFKDVISHDAGMHGLSMRIVRGAIIDNCEAYNTKGYGWDLSTSTYAEISNNYAHDNDMGSKYPGSTYVYLHDNRLENNGLIGMKFNKLTGSEQYWHIENNSVINCASGVADWGDTYSIPTMQQLVVRGNTLSGNSSNKIRIRGVIETYEYHDNIGIVEARAGTINPIQIDSGSTPAEDYVGYTSWPAYH
jgi:nitrous oxidase accessory protein NosD